MMEKTVIAIVAAYNKEKKILLQLRTKDAPYYPGYWGFFGGHVEENETPEEALLREAKEEIELSITDFTLFKTYESIEDGILYVRSAYLTTCDESVAILRSRQHEGDDLGFFSQEEAEKLHFVPSNLSILRDLYTFLYAEQHLEA